MIQVSLCQRILLLIVKWSPLPHFSLISTLAGELKQFPFNSLDDVLSQSTHFDSIFKINFLLVAALSSVVCPLLAPIVININGDFYCDQIFLWILLVSIKKKNGKKKNTQLSNWLFVCFCIQSKVYPIS